MLGEKLDKRMTDVVIRMAWEGRITFEEIEKHFGISEQGLVQLMRQHLKPSSFRMWMLRVSRCQREAHKGGYREKAVKSSPYGDFLNERNRTQLN